jgi:hypothetical protein
MPVHSVAAWGRWPRPVGGGLTGLAIFEAGHGFHELAHAFVVPGLGGLQFGEPGAGLRFEVAVQGGQQFDGLGDCVGSLGETVQPFVGGHLLVSPGRCLDCISAPRWF